jgi:hypothetical protein
VRRDQNRAHHTTTTWRITTVNDAERARSSDTWCHVIADYGYMQPKSLRQGRARTGISERTKQEFCPQPPWMGSRRS